MTGTSPTPPFAVTAVSIGTAQLMRDFTIPFSVDLQAAAEESGWATELPPVRIGDRTIDITTMPRTAVAGPGHDLAVGVLAVVALKLSSGVVDALIGDLYDQLLKKPAANLWRRLRDKPPPPGSQVRVITEIWFAEDQVLLKVEVVAFSGEAGPDLEAQIKRATRAAEAFVRQSILPAASSVHADGAGGPEDVGSVEDRDVAVPRVVHVKVERDGSMSGPAFTAPLWWMLPPADGYLSTPRHPGEPAPTRDETGETRETDDSAP